MHVEVFLIEEFAAQTLRSLRELAERIERGEEMEEMFYKDGQEIGWFDCLPEETDEIGKRD
jgi:hypothetical protein